MNKVLLLSIVLFNLIRCLFGLNLTYYPVLIKSTNASTVSSFQSCACKCLSSSTCRYFGYWSSPLPATCQIYTELEGKPDIVGYNLTNSDNQTGLYSIPISTSYCNLSVPDPSFHYTNNSNSNIPLWGKRIISVLVMSINSNTRLLAIDNTNFSYVLFDLNTFQVIDNDTFLPAGCTALCARQYSNYLYICCALNIIEVRQFQSVGNSSIEKPKLINSYSTAGGGAPECLAVLNDNILYYVIGPGDVYVLLTSTNTSKLIYSFSSVMFASPSVVIALDSINMRLFLASSKGTLFQLQLSSINMNNGTSNISIDHYQMPLNISTSILIDKCNQLWAFATQAGFAQQLFLFVQQDYSNNSFSTMNIINYTNTLPAFAQAPYSFEFDSNYSLFTANTHLGIYAYFRA